MCQAIKGGTTKPSLCSAGGFRSGVWRMLEDLGWVLGKALLAEKHSPGRGHQRGEGISMAGALQSSAQNQSQPPGLALLSPCLEGSFSCSPAAPSTAVLRGLCNARSRLCLLCTAWSEQKPPRAGSTEGSTNSEPSPGCKGRQGAAVTLQPALGLYTSPLAVSQLRSFRQVLQTAPLSAALGPHARMQCSSA